MPEPFVPNDALVEEVARIAGGTPLHWERITGGGYTRALRLLVRLPRDRSVFVKVATTPDTATWIREERQVYEALTAEGGFSFHPHYFGAGEAEGSPFLVLEDLSACHWPPPWANERVEAVREALRELHSAAPAALLAPAGLPALRARLAGASGWPAVLTDPTPFLSLGLCSRDWLCGALPTLLAAADAAPLEGEDLVHLDVRSDNLCFRAPEAHDHVREQAVLIDWNWSCIGNGLFDVAGWLPSLCAEGGPTPEEVLPAREPGVAYIAAWLAGFWATHAGRPANPDAPRVREMQLRQLKVALPWAARLLDLPAPDGGTAQETPGPAANGAP